MYYYNLIGDEISLMSLPVTLGGYNRSIGSKSKNIWMLHKAPNALKKKLPVLIGRKLFYITIYI